MTEPMERGKKWLEELLQLMGTPAAVKTETKESLALESSWLIIDETSLSPKQVEVLIGNKGETIDALQYLASTILNLGVDSDIQRPFTVELNCYRVRRQEELFALAEQLAQQVRETGQEIEVQSLSSAERRQIHTFLKDSEDIETESRGQEPNRRLVVKLR